jgi:alpha-beta hydrolase superfamily lysophospholipase
MRNNPFLSGARTMSPFTHDNAAFKATDGIEIVYRRWIPDKAAGSVIIIHGIGEHSGRYTELAEALAAKKIAVFAPDLRGHGRSGGIRGHVESFRDYLTDIKLLTNIAKGLFADLPLAYLGHSMGGVIAARYALNFKHDPAALVLSSPAFVPTVQISPMKKIAAAVLSRFAPASAVKRGMHPDQLTHDKAEAKAYMEDPLVHHVISPRLYSGMNEHAAFCLEHSNEIRIPLLLIHGTADTVCAASGSESFFAGASSEDKTFVPLPNLAHETLHETPRERKKAVSLIVSWVASRFSEANHRHAAEGKEPAKKAPKAKTSPVKKTAAKKKAKAGKSAPKKTAKAAKKGTRR